MSEAAAPKQKWQPDPLVDKETGAPLPAKYEGYIEVQLPDFDEHYEMVETIDIEKNAKGEVDRNKLASVKNLRQIVKACQRFILDVNMKLLEDGTEAKSLADMKYDRRFDSLMIEFGIDMFNGLPPKKN